MSYPKVQNLLYHVKSGVFYARLIVNGKLIRRPIGANVFTAAKLKLSDFIKEPRTRKPIIGTFCLQCLRGLEAVFVGMHFRWFRLVGASKA